MKSLETRFRGCQTPLRRAPGLPRLNDQTELESWDLHRPFELILNPMEPNQRLVSLDAFRGTIMLFMASSGFGIHQMAKANPGTVWSDLIPHISHAEWQGCAPWDLIQPAFMFMVGMACALSYTRRKREGQSFFGMSGHMLSRALLLVVLGVILSTRSTVDQTTFVFTNVLAQIGLGYIFLVPLARLGWEYCVSAILVICVGYWYYFYSHPISVDPAVLGASAEGLLDGVMRPWSIHINAAADFDRWFLNLLPRAEPWVNHSGGYVTLNFIPSLATMLGGAVAGEYLRNSPAHPGKKGLWIFVVGLICIGIGLALGFTVCPIVKRIWTPSWVFFSGGWVLMLLALFVWVVDAAGWKKLVFPLVVVGMNSLTIYLLHSFCQSSIRRGVLAHFGVYLKDNPYLPLIEYLGMLFVLWLVCLWLYRQRAFLRL